MTKKFNLKCGGLLINGNIISVKFIRGRQIKEIIDEEFSFLMPLSKEEGYYIHKKSSIILGLSQPLIYIDKEGVI